MSEPHGKFCWYELMTTDPQAAGAFYTRVIGWQAEDSGLADTPYTLFKVEGQGVGGVMAVPEEARQAGARPGWIGYIWVRDLDAALAQLQAAGGAIRRPAGEIPGVGRFAVVADPQGAIFVLFRNFGEQEAPTAPPGTPGHIGWHELHADNWESAFDFYAGQFGWTKADTFDMGPEMGLYQIFTTQSGQGGGMMNRIPITPGPFWNFYINVDDIDAAATRVSEAGGQVMHGPQEVPGGNWIIQGRDPQGAMFALVGPRR